MKKTLAIILTISLVSFLAGLYLYPQMPNTMASHWNVAGQVDGYLPKFWGLFLMPFLTLGLSLLFILIPKIDPLKENLAKFRKYYDGFFVLLSFFLLYLYLLTILWNLGARFNLIQVLTPAFGILFYYCGVLVQNAKRNWFIGIRTPWTLSSEQVWDKTHQGAGKWFKAAGIIALLAIFLPNYAIFFVLTPVLLVAAYAVFYSYFEYQKERSQPLF